MIIITARVYKPNYNCKGIQTADTNFHLPKLTSFLVPNKLKPVGQVPILLFLRTNALSQILRFQKRLAVFSLAVAASA